MKDVSDTHLLLRNGTWYYRRKVPDHLVVQIGRKMIQHSLGTKNKAEARKRRDIENVKWDAQFEACEIGELQPSAPSDAVTLSPAEMWALVRGYVERKDGDFRKWYVDEAPTQEQRGEMIMEDEMAISELSSPDDPPYHEWINDVERKVLGDAGLQLDSIPEKARPQFAEIVRRALLELTRRQLAIYADRFDKAFFDGAFDPEAPEPVTFGQLAEQYLAMKQEEGEANNASEKWLDKTKAQVALARELIGDRTLVHDIDYDQCLRARSLLARVPSNRTKYYPGLNLEKVTAKAAKDGKPLMSPVTQARYLDTLRDILELGTLKRLLPNNPASGLRPLKRDDVRPEDKRPPFTLDQIKTFFVSDFYKSCAPDAAKPYAKKDREWRFWLPLLSLFMGMRPIEICQMLPSDVKQTAKGTWYVDVVASADNDEEGSATAGPAKTLKTATSRRKIPVHPELIALGFVDFALRQQTAKAERLFEDLKPDTYGNLATYALKRFRDTFLKDAVALKSKQTFYSFRHSFRDALRRGEAGPDVLKALGGWSQGSVASDAYGDKSDPDLYVDAIGKVSYPGLELAHLRPQSSEVPPASAIIQDDAAE